MEIQVLGTLLACENRVSVVPTAPKPRRALALLALHADQVVPVTVLIDELWGKNPPRSARSTLQTYILQLREMISRALATSPDELWTAKDIIATVPGGYRLATRGGTVDYREFERRTESGYRAMDTLDHSGAARHLGAALSLWSGPALTDIEAGPQIVMEAQRLEEARLCALEQRIEAELRLGRHRELLAELTVLVNQYRMHEHLHGQFMLALHRSGRRVEALNVYQRLRSTLVTELGLEPSGALSSLQRHILLSRTGTASAADDPLAVG
ncbi:hypothetical protein AA958_30310 [Streptomyces sp. CNQ-509]|uniref:AfsR/SARP family transcriptional regulator n=1 Tax=Streptomyces sp. CNQ-509 TaxID=444103 RepID=UPI00062DEB5F|nr:AfsR/SARP family transcriptional regulator [Streptomyces sp. CNQ-509]AKH85800.1 hypothetical protein AA958_30310 [Streptomyces sp. CNQ-509]